jgi:hypothetical protein
MYVRTAVRANFRGQPHTSKASPPRIFTGEAETQIVNVLRGEVTNAAPQLRRNRKEHSPQRLKAARCDHASLAKSASPL